MAFFIFIVSLFIFWLIAAIIGRKKSSNDTTNFSLLDNTVLPPNVNSRTVIKFGKLVYQTKSLNKILLSISQKGKKIWQIWFSMGVFFGFLAILLSTIVLLFSFSLSLYSLIYKINSSNNAINISINPMVNIESNGLSSIENSNFVGGNNKTVYQNNTFEYTKNQKEEMSIIDDLIVLNTFSGENVVINKTLPISYDNYVKSLVYGNWNEYFEYEESFAEHTAKKYNQFLVSVIPGINLPLWHIGYYLLATFLSGIIHEFGHAIAALSENISIYSTGAFFYIVFPGAFVNMDDHLLSLLKPFHQLRIFCAGVWHNVWLCILCYILLITMPYWLIGYSQSNNELYVLDVNKNSPLYGYVHKGSIIHSINDQPIPYGNDGFEIMLRQSLIKNPINHPGYCISKELYEENDSSCCKVSLEKPLSTSNLQCFEHHESLLDLYEVYMNEKTFSVERGKEYIPTSPLTSKCSNFINIIKNAKQCYIDSDCIESKENLNRRSMSNSLNYNQTIITNLSHNPNKLILSKRENTQEMEEYEDLNIKEYFENLHSYKNNLDTYCMTPYIPNPFMRVIKFQVNDYPKDHYAHYREVIFLSDPREVWDSVKVGNFFPKISILPFFIPYMIEYTLKYTISLSAALSILNMIPAFNMDGYHAFFALMKVIAIIFSKTKKKLKVMNIKERFKILFSSNFYVSLVNDDDENNEEMLSNAKDKYSNKWQHFIEKIIPWFYTGLLIVAIISGIIGALSGNGRSLV
ncbi:hypothetical protein BCR32DRAFT_294703 [Anaeromyces robustus]|uniref:Endopeptidase S2P n=1 Tax=Anaeromyces robustus TaxID=1754192 RepID=A0A1Y1WZH7_9FUNG|nr:hypothetical protein BCR32DRAFT_294703 [Anaeromyces robustus]|eukprot:ORX78987.1 hypothetical protein BCR32DRAFT_294703 [Anaeromyces robustus]